MDYYLALAYFMKIGSATLSKGLAACGTIGNFYHASAGKLQTVLGDKLSGEFVRFRETFAYEQVVEELRRRKIEFLTPANGGMPPQLQDIPDAPMCLFVKGDPASLTADLIIGIVGTRKVSSYGRQVTTFFSSQLANHGVSVVSGMAYGVDALAHQGCLSSAGMTIAVLGCGVDIIYPAANRLLYGQIMESGGAIVSELPPGTMPKPFTFVLRNRLIAGLARGVLVVEGTLSSGSMITAQYAIEQGKDVFAVPMPLMSPLSAAPNSLLKQGAKLVLDPQDILAEYGKHYCDTLSNLTIKLSKHSRIIYDALKTETQSLQMLIERSGRRAAEIMQEITSMEMEGLIRKNNEGNYEVITYSQSV